MQPLEFQVETVSLLAAKVLAVGTGIYAVMTAWYAERGLENRLEDRWSAASATLVMALLTILLWYEGAWLLPAPFSLWVIGVYIFSILFTLTYTLGKYRDRIAAFKGKFGKRMEEVLQDSLPSERYEAWQNLRERAQLTPEERRKFPHLLMGLFMIFYVALGAWVLRGMDALIYSGNSENAHNLGLVTDAGWLVGGHMFALTLLMGLLFVLLPMELLRLSFPELGYPFKSIVESRLRPKEEGLFGAHYYVTATLPLAIMWLARDSSNWDVTIYAVLAILGVTIFADAASALFGVKWGKTKWFHHPNKTYVGSAGGTVVAILVAYPFVGLEMALVTGAVFLFIDIIAPIPIPVSDNILNPIALMITYAVLESRLAPVLPFY